MIAEALKFFSELSRKAGGFHTITTPDGATHVLRPNGEVASVAHPFLECNDELTTVSSIIEWINESEESSSEVFVSNVSIDVVRGRNEFYPPDRSRLILAQSQSFAVLSGFLRPGCLVTQREIVRALRGPLAGTNDPALLTVFRSIEFRSDTSKNSEINRGGDSLGRQINRTARIGEAGELPDVIRFAMPIFSIADAPQVTIEVAVEVNYEAEKFEFLPVGETIARATEASVKSIAAELSNRTEAAVYFGSYR